MEAIIRDDVIAVTPATPTAAPAGLGSTGDPSFNSPWSHAGLPTVTIPCGLTSEGLPCGLQLIAPPHQEQRLLSVAAWCEQAIAFRADRVWTHSRNAEGPRSEGGFSRRPHL